MYRTTQSISNPVQTIFGPGYVQEQHSEQTNLAEDSEPRFVEFVKSLRSLLWNDDGAAKH